jgi:hypothetical protein
MPPRGGLVTMWALLVLAFLGMLLALTTSQILACRRALDQRQSRLRAAWLARSGLELAAARLLADPAGYPGESVELVPDSKVRIEVKSQPGAKDVFEVVSEAHFPLEGRDQVLLSLTRRFRRVADGGRVRLEVLQPEKRDPEKIGPPREGQ